MRLLHLAKSAVFAGAHNQSRSKGSSGNNQWILRHALFSVNFLFMARFALGQLYCGSLAAVNTNASG